MKHKFRVWNGKKYVTKPIYLKCSDGSLYDYERDYGGTFSSNEILSQVSGVIVEQWTGLTDINGQEIYEGDLVAVYPENYEKIQIAPDIYELHQDHPLPLKDIVLFKGKVVWEAPEFRILVDKDENGVSSVGMRDYWLEITGDESPVDPLRKAE